MTTWVEEREGGRARGPRGIVRAWVEVLARPRRFFESGVAAGDQAPGLTFAVVVAGVAAVTTLATGSGPVEVVEAGGEPLLVPRPLVFGAVVLFVAPALLHLAAALQTLLLAPLGGRAGVSETVQVLAYATAPCALAGVPVPVLRLACCVWGATLFAVGVAARHDVSLPAAAALTVPTSAVVFGVAYGGFAAARAVGDAVASGALSGVA